MRDHYQVNASLTVLSFMIHQIEWRIECDDKAIAAEVERQMRPMWTRLIRGMSQAFWAGYSPMVLQWDNNVPDRRIELTKIKDLVPEDCRVNWREVEGYAPPTHAKPKLKVYDGIVEYGNGWPIPVDNSFWYPMLMENGDYYGRKLLRSAFPPWFFSILIHLFANRYFERFGEPLPIGRYPQDSMVEFDGAQMSSRKAMEQILLDLRNRSVVSLPSERDPESKEHEWDIEYLESQMRGADWERYLTRLDEEMSLALFTPLLLLRVADVGSYNLGVSHMQMYLWQLNALASDMKEYIDRYVVERIKALNFTPRAPRCEWIPRKLGKDNIELVRMVLTELVRQNQALPDLDQLGEMVGLDLQKVQQLTGRDDDDDDGDDSDDRSRAGRDQGVSDGPRGVGEPRATTRDISARVADQVTNAFRKGTFRTGFMPDLGYRKHFESALVAEGASAQRATQLAEQFYSKVRAWAHDAIALGASGYNGPREFMALFDRVVNSELDRLL